MCGYEENACSISSFVFFFCVPRLLKTNNSETRAHVQGAVRFCTGGVAHILTHYGWCYGRGQMVLAITSCLVSRCFALAAVAGSYCVDSTGANR